MANVARIEWKRTALHPVITHHQDAASAFCRAYGVQRRDLFGSAATAAFDPSRGDIDFLVEYPDGYDHGPWLSRLQELEEALARLLGRDVDVVMTVALTNAWFRREAAKTRTVVYAGLDPG